MRKLSLDALAVDLFGTGAAPGVRGTVPAHELAVTGVCSCAATCRCPSHHDTECC
jgi:hypothetical protein